jgi:hypothetical protein
MDRFLQEVTDEAHGRVVSHREVHHTSHPRPLSREGLRTYTFRSSLPFDIQRMTDFSPGVAATPNT